MKNTPILAIVLIAGLLAAWGCKPGTTADGSADNSEKRLIRMEYADDSTSTIHFFYYANGDISRMYNSTDTSSFEYTADSIVLTWFDGLGKTTARQVFATNSQGKITGHKVMDPQGNIFSTSENTYDGQGFLTRHVRTNARTNDVFAMNYEYKDGNIAFVRITRNGEPFDIFGYSYDQSLKNRFAIDLDQLMQDFFTRERLGKLNANLPVSAFRITPEGDTVSHRKISYVTDPDGYVTQRTDTDAAGTYSTVRNFFYE